MGLNCTFFPFPEEYRRYRQCRQYRQYRQYRENSGRLIWNYDYNGFGSFGPENGSRFSYIFDFQGRIYLKAESALFATYQNFDFHGRIYLKVERCIFIQVHQILGPAPEGLRSSPKAPKESKEFPRGPKSPPRAPL